MCSEAVTVIMCSEAVTVIMCSESVTVIHSANVGNRGIVIESICPV